MKLTCCLIIVLFCTIFANAQEKQNIFDIARKGSLEQMKEFYIQNPKSIFDINNDGNTALILATYRGNNAVAKFLLEKGSNINEKTNMGTPLMAAVVKGNNEIAKLLLEKNANVNETDPNGTTALIYATMFKNYEIVSLLVKAKANTEVKDNRGNSALSYAILQNDDKLIEIIKTK